MTSTENQLLREAAQQALDALYLRGNTKPEALAINAAIARLTRALSHPTAADQPQEQGQDAIELVGAFQKACVELGQDMSDDNHGIMVQNRLALIAALSSQSASNQPVNNPQVVGLADAVETALVALDSAQNGLRWYQDERPSAASPADDETHEQIDEACEKLNALLIAAQQQPQAPEQVATDVVAWLHQCRKKPELRYLSFIRDEKGLAALGFKARPLTYAATPPAPKLEPMTPGQRAEIFRQAERRMVKDLNLSWRNAIVEGIEAHHGISTKEQANDKG
jgi:hypothetical protein